MALLMLINASSISVFAAEQQTPLQRLQFQRPDHGKAGRIDNPSGFQAMQHSVSQLTGGIMQPDGAASSF